MESEINSKSFLIYIPPSQEISDLLELANSSLRANHISNTYLPLLNGKWHSHLMLYLSPMPFDQQNNIIKVVENVVDETVKFKVALAETEMADANYLQVRITDKSQIPIRTIRQKLVEELLPFRDKTIKEKYLQRWDTFTEDEKQRIKTTGIPYNYEPHLTLGVFSDQKELEQAYKESLEFNFNGLSFTAKNIEILTSIGSDFRDKEIIFSKSFENI